MVYKQEEKIRLYSYDQVFHAFGFLLLSKNHSGFYSAAWGFSFIISRSFAARMSRNVSNLHPLQWNFANFLNHDKITGLVGFACLDKGKTWFCNGGI